MSTDLLYLVHKDVNLLHRDCLTCCGEVRMLRDMAKMYAHRSLQATTAIKVQNIMLCA